MKRRILKAKKWIYLALLAWILLGGFIFFFPPDTFYAFLPFYALVSLALFTSSRIVFNNTRSILWPGIIILYLLLRQFRLDTLFNGVLLFGLAITLEVYLRRN